MIFSNTYFRVMKKHFLVLLITVVSASFSAEAQTRGIRIGYIDMEYILENVPDYTQAKEQLEEKAQKWKQEIEVKKNEIVKFKETLKIERTLLTKELIEEREDEIKFLEGELLDYQQKRFGPGGDLILQKAGLIKPIQDQIFTAVQDMAESKKYDFIFDKSSDLTILYGAKKYDVSDQVVRALTRASKRGQVSKKELKEIEAQEAKEDMEDDNPALAERKKILEDKKAERERLLEERKKAFDDRKKAFDERREKLRQEREAKKNGETPTEEDISAKKTNDNSTTAEAKKEAEEERNKKIEERKKDIEERKQKILEAREAARKEREEKLKEREENKNRN